MRDTFDEIIRNSIKDTAENISILEPDSERLLSDILNKTEERSKIMRFGKGKKLALAFAAVFVVGGITAIAGGRIAMLSSSTYVNEAVTNADALINEAAGKLGTEPVIKEELSDGTKFVRGFLSEVNMADDSGNDMGAYPEVTVDYSGANGEQLFLSISKVPEELKLQQQAENGEKTADEIYDGTEFRSAEYNYLFLPPSAEPSEEDLELEAAGDLVISYGSDEEERKVFKDVSWEKDGLQYLLSTYDEGTDSSELLELAKEMSIAE